MFSRISHRALDTRNFKYDVSENIIHNGKLGITGIYAKKKDQRKMPPKP